MAINMKTGLRADDKPKENRFIFTESELNEHDAKVRADAIEEFRKFSYCKVCEEKGWNIYCEYCRVCQSQEYIAEQLKEQKNEK